jgi:ATP-dependent DNA ligase
MRPAAVLQSALATTRLAGRCDQPPARCSEPPSGPEWIHEIKYDGYRLIARRDPVCMRLLTRNGHDWAPRYPLIVEAMNVLKVRSCLIDGKAVVCDDNGLAILDLLRNKRQGRHVFLCVFDLLELNGDDLRREPVEVRKAGWRNWCASLAQTIPHLGFLAHPSPPLVPC